MEKKLNFRYLIFTVEKVLIFFASGAKTPSGGADSLDYDNEHNLFGAVIDIRLLYRA